MLPVCKDADAACNYFAGHLYGLVIINSGCDWNRLGSEAIFEVCAYLYSFWSKVESEKSFEILS